MVVIAMLCVVSAALGASVVGVLWKREQERAARTAQGEREVFQNYLDSMGVRGRVQSDAPGVYYVDLTSDEMEKFEAMKAMVTLPPSDVS